MIIIDFGAGDLLKLSEASCRLTADGAGATGADRLGITGVSGDDFAQHFFHRAKEIKLTIIKLPIIAACDENNQGIDWKALYNSSNFWRLLLESNSPVILDLSSFTIFVICSLSL